MPSRLSAAQIWLPIEHQGVSRIVFAARITPNKLFFQGYNEFAVVVILEAARMCTRGVVIGDKSGRRPSRRVPL